MILLLIVPLIMTFVSGFQGDKAHHEEKLEKAKAAAVEKESIVMEADRDRRKFFPQISQKAVPDGDRASSAGVRGRSGPHQRLYVHWVGAGAQTDFHVLFCGRAVGMCAAADILGRLFRELLLL